MSSCYNILITGSSRQHFAHWLISTTFWSLAHLYNILITGSSLQHFDHWLISTTFWTLIYGTLGIINDITRRGQTNPTQKDVHACTLNTQNIQKYMYMANMWLSNWTILEKSMLAEHELSSFKLSKYFLSSFPPSILKHYNQNLFKSRHKHIVVLCFFSCYFVVLLTTWQQYSNNWPWFVRFMTMILLWTSISKSHKLILKYVDKTK